MRVALMFAMPIILVGAARPDTAPPQTIDVHLDNFRFTPGVIRLMHGQSYVLHLTNDSGGGHNFVAKDFLKAATLDTGGRYLVRSGAIEVPSHETVDIRFVAPHAGRYKIKCSHFLHAGFGMTGEIVVV